MTMPPLSPREFEQLSAYLDGQLNASEQGEVQRRLVERPDLRQALDELRQTRAMLRNAPRRKVPRNFMLKPAMVPARRRAFGRPVFSLGLASALATFFLMLSVMLEFVPVLSFGASAPMAPQALDGSTGRNLASQAPQPSAMMEMSKSAGMGSPTAMPTPVPTQAMKVAEATRPVAQPATALTPTPTAAVRITGDNATQAAPPPSPTKAPEATQMPSPMPQTTLEPRKPTTSMDQQPTETRMPQEDELPITRSEPRRTLTWLQTLLVVLAVGTALAALYLRRRH